MGSCNSSIDIRVNYNPLNAWRLSGDLNREFCVSRVLGFDFGHDSFTVTLTAIGGGEVSGGGEYAFEEDATVTATADEGYIFCGWNTTPAVMTPEYTFTMPNEDVTLTACFAPKQAVDQYVIGNELITKDDVKEMAFDAPVVEVGADAIEIFISLQTAESLDAWQAMALEGAILKTENGMITVIVPKGDAKAAFYKFVVPDKSEKE